MIGDRLRGFFANAKDRFVSVGNKISGRIEQAKQVIGEAVKNAPAKIEDAIGFMGRQMVTISKSVGESGYNVVRGTTKGLGESVTDTLSGGFNAPVILAGLGVAAFIAAKVL